MKHLGQDYLNRWEDEKEEREESARRFSPVAHFKSETMNQTDSKELRIRQAIVNELSQFLSNKWSDMLALKIMEIFSKYT